MEKGYDPREFSLVCFGGNGPLHAVELAEELDIGRMVIPFAPGVNCAYGLLVADFRHDYVKTYVKKFSEITPGEMGARCDDLERDARDRMAGDEIPDEDIVISHSLDIRYLGQGYELEVPIPAGEITRESLESIEDQFHALHEQTYGFSKRGEPTELVNLRLACVGLVPKPELPREPLEVPDPKAALKGEREVFLKGRFQLTAIYDRERLNPGALLRGPAIIEQKDSTTLLFPGDTGHIDEYRNIIIELGSQR